MLACLTDTMFIVYGDGVLFRGGRGLIGGKSSLLDGIAKIVPPPSGCILAATYPRGPRIFMVYFVLKTEVGRGH